MSRLVAPQIAVVSLISIILTTGCVATSVNLNSNYEPPSQENASSTNIDYRLVVKSVSDIRKDKDSLGALGLTDVSSEDIIQWLKNAFLHRGYQIDNQLASKRPPCEVDIGLKLAYIRSSSTSKATNIVLAIRYGETEDMTYYRGSYSGINWNSSESEIKTSFNQALGKALDSMETGLSEMCAKPV